MDCLRILTTGNDANKVALFSIPAAMPALVRLMSSKDQVSACLARAGSAAACSGTERHYLAGSGWALAEAASAVLLGLFAYTCPSIARRSLGWAHDVAGLVG